MNNTLRIFDTTLRDGEQAPGFSMNLDEKLLMAQQLECLGVDVMEAGFANASPQDFESVRQIGQLCEKAEICGLARCHEGDIQATIKALSGAQKPRIHVFIATSDIHLEYKLKMTRDQAIAKAIEGVKMAKSFTPRVDFSPEDATRSDRTFLVEILSEAVKAGADVLNIPDTVGYAIPSEFYDLISFLREHVYNGDQVIFSTHCHDDLGLAVANSLAGIRAGARQVECTINGIGERAGNAALEEVVMAMRTRSDLYPYETGINTKQILTTSRLLTQITGQFVQPNKSIVGENAFAHEAGIHQHGILANKETYEIMKPEDVGYTDTQLVLGKHSGRNALVNRLRELQVSFDETEIPEIFKRFKALADKKKHIYDEDLILLAQNRSVSNYYELLDMSGSTGKGTKPSAEVTLRVGEDTVTAKAEGNGIVSALYNAIIKATGLEGQLTKFQLGALTPDSDAIAYVNASWKTPDGHEFHGYGADTDITVAGVRALVDILNHRHVRQEHEQNKNL